MSTTIRPLLQHATRDALHVLVEGGGLGLEHGQHVLGNGEAEILQGDRHEL